MNKPLILLALAALATPLLAVAAAPKPLKVADSVTIKAAPEKVWAAAKDFDSLNKWHPAVEKDQISKGSNNTVGAVRTLSLKGGGTIVEELTAFNEGTHSFRYKILESPLPVARYVATFTVKPGKDGGSVITWVGTFTRKNPADNPPEDQTDAAARKTIAGIYSSGLANLKKQLEGQTS